MNSDSETEPLIGIKQPDQNDGHATIIRPELRAYNLGFRHPNEKAFYLSQWSWPGFLFPLLRVTFAIYMVIWLYMGMLYFPRRDKYPWQCYLTNWSFTLLCFHLVLSATITVVYNCSARQPCCQKTSLEDMENNTSQSGTVAGENSNPDDVPFIMKLDWIIFSTISNIAIIVTIVYFGLLYPYLHRPGELPSIKDVHVHAVNSAVILLELCFNAIPIRLFHAVYPFIYGIIYSIFSVIFWSIDHSRVIYPVVLDWNSLKTTFPALLILGFVLVPIVQITLFGIYRLKLKIYARIYHIN